MFQVVASLSFYNNCSYNKLTNKQKDMNSSIPFLVVRLKIPCLISKVQDLRYVCMSSHFLTLIMFYHRDARLRMQNSYLSDDNPGWPLAGRGRLGGRGGGLRRGRGLFRFLLHILFFIVFDGLDLLLHLLLGIAVDPLRKIE